MPWWVWRSLGGMIGGRDRLARCRSECPDPMRTSRRKGVPEASSEQALRRMQAQATRDTGPELTLRAMLHRMGFRFRVNRQPFAGLRRQADIVFPRARVAVFVDGCFWHGCPTHGTWPKANADFWRAKIEANRRRDLDTNEQLVREGWLVVRAWERTDSSIAASTIADLVRARGGEDLAGGIVQLSD